MNLKKFLNHRPYVRPKLNEAILYKFPNKKRYLLMSFLPGFIKKRYMKIEVGDRIVEMPFTLTNLDLKPPAEILDFGCVMNKLSIELASIGHKVTGIDLRDYELNHPNLKFLKGDFLKMDLPENHYDAVISISVIEHIGFEVYGGQALEGGDKQAVDKIHKLLKKGGIFIITVPFGKKREHDKWRVYDDESLRDLLRGFKIEKEQYFIDKNRRYWIPIDKKSLKGTCGAGCVLCRKT